MQKTFYKFQGTGNDFILFDNRDLWFDKQNTKRISELCDRKFGIGSDGLMLIESHSDRLYNLVFFNPDGSQSFCGNGTRCSVALAKQFGIVEQEGVIEATDGTHDIKIDNNNWVSVHMRNVDEFKTFGDDMWLYTGSPHYIVFVDDVDSVNVYEDGRKRRYAEPWGQEGTNVNFVEIVERGIKIRTYERGVENETLSCGTGVTAAAIAAHKTGKISGETIRVETLGGNLEVNLNLQNDVYTNVWLNGPAEKVFEGTIDV